MNNFLIIIFLIFDFFGNKQEIEIIKSNKIEFDKAYKSLNFIKTSDVKRTKNKIILQCKILMNDNSDENYKSFYYLGNVPNASNLKVIQQENYNGNIFFIYDDFQNCKETDLLGRPFLYNNFIITNNEEETTDNINRITVWEIVEKKVVKNREILIGDIIVDEMKYRNNFVFIKSLKNSYFKIKIN